MQRIPSEKRQLLGNAENPQRETLVTRECRESLAGPLPTLVPYSLAELVPEYVYAKALQSASSRPPDCHMRPPASLNELPRPPPEPPPVFFRSCAGVREDVAGPWHKSPGNPLLVKKR